MKLFSVRRFGMKLPVVLLFVFGILSARGAGEIDLSFKGALINFPAQSVSFSVVQPDDKILVYGNFEAADGHGVNTLIRLNADGTLDTTFNAPKMEPTITGYGIGVQSLALQSDGKIIVGGYFTNVVDVTANVEAHVLVRLNPDGSRDMSFAFPSATTPLRRVDQVVVLPDNSILFSANESTSGNSFNIIKLHPDGSPDNSLTPCGGRQFRLQPDGKILRSYGNDISRCNADGTADGTFQAISASSIYSFDVQADGKIIFVGDFTTVNGFNMPRIARANANGTIDPAFTSTLTPVGTIFKVLVLPDGKVLIAGSLVGSTNGGINRLNSDGTRDTSFNQVAAGNSSHDLDIQSDGKIIRSSSPFNTTVTAMARLNTDGSTDAAFQPNFGKHGSGRTVFVQPDGKILVSGLFAYAGKAAKPNLARFNSDGSVDTGFNPDFTLFTSAYVRSFAVQPDGKIIAGVNSTTVDSRRLNADGTTDVVFPNTKNAYKVKVLSDGKILIAGQGYVKRYNSDGSLDSGFNVTLNSPTAAFVYGIIVQSDGKIIIGGIFAQVNSVARTNIARLNSDGTLDTAYTAAVNSTIFDMAAQSDGKIVIGGTFGAINFTTGYRRLARLNADGTLDTAYRPIIPTDVLSLRIQPDNKVFVGGNFTTFGSDERQDLTRFNVDGSLDASFNVPGDINVPDGFNSWVYSIDLQKDGKVIIAGEFSRVGRAPALGIARLLNVSTPRRVPFDFDGDGRTDIGVWRAPSNSWWYLHSSDLSGHGHSFGLSDDIITPGDYTGDGKTDVAIWRPSTGEWFVRRSEDGSYYSYSFGLPGDIPAPADYDGDGKTDTATFRPSTATWYIFNTGSGTYSILTFGLDGDKPVPADFDGDGKADIAVWRPSNGTWWIVNSSNLEQRGYGFGLGTDKPVVGDYTGDGKADIAVWRDSSREWFFLRSEDGSYYSYQSGLSGDIPAPGDYDGDGRFDSAVFRPSTQTWYIDGSTSGSMIMTFGLNGDRPVANAFVP